MAKLTVAAVGPSAFGGMKQLALLVRTQDEALRRWSMYATSVRFSMPLDTDWEALRQALVRRAFDFLRSLPGLRSMAILFSPERGEIGANYVWLTQDAAEAYLHSPGWREVMARWGEPRLEGAESCAYIEDGDLLYPPEYQTTNRTVASPPAAPPL